MKEQCHVLEITQLMLRKFTVDENVDHRQNRHSLNSFMLVCFYVNSRCYMPRFMDVLNSFTQFGGMDLRPRDKAAERPVRYMCSDLVDFRESRLK